MATTTTTVVSTDQLVSNFTDALANVKEFPAGEFSNRLFNKVRLSSFLQNIRDDVAAEKSFGSDAESSKLHGIDVAPLLDAMAAQSLARVLGDLDSTVDQFGFRHCVDTGSAKGWFEDSIIRIAPLLLAEHISDELKAANPSLPDIQDLRNNATFVNSYHETLKDKKFIQGTIMSDVVKKDHRHSTNLIFMLAYFDSKLQLDDVVANDNVWARKIGSVGVSWITELIDGLKHEVEPVVEHISKSFAPVFAYQRPETMSVYDKAKLQNNLFIANPSLPGVVNAQPAVSNAVKQIQAKLSQIQQGANLNWRAIQDQMWTGMKASSSKLQDAVRTHATRTTTSEDYQYGFGWSGITYTHTTGANVVSLIDKGAEKYPKIFTGKAPNHSTQDYQQLANAADNNAGYWCLRAGTIITTDDGFKAVEELQDGDTVLTFGSLKHSERPVKYGVVSSEARRIVTTNPKVYGINGSLAFFTGSHVFHTTTGLRAVDPIAAGKANPSVSVGELQVGHVLFHLGSGTEYELVTIQSLDSEVMEDVKVVYDVHLAEGRSYHANGYLTSVNYPEVSPKQVAEALSRLAPHDRLKMLYKFPELQDIISQWDPETLSEALSLEIRQEMKRRTARFYKAGPPGGGRVPLLDINRTFQCFNFRGETREPLPNSISLREGLVTIDDHELLTQARVDQKSSRVLWTRPLSSGRFEHGRVELESTGMTGRGAVVYTKGLQADASEAAKSIDNPVSFRLFAVAPQTRRKNVELQISSTADEESGIDRDALEMADMPQVAPLVAESYGLMAAAPMTMDVNLPVPIEQDTDFSFTFQLDKDPLPVGVDPASMKTLSKPVDFGNLILKITLPNGPKGIKLLTVSVPHLNRLRAAINEATPGYRNAFIESLKSSLPGSGSEDFKNAGIIDTLYTSSVVQNEKGQLVANIRMIDASSLAQAADFGNDISKKFTGALPGSNVTVPLIFQELEVVIRSDFRSAQGVVYEWDDGAKGMLGTRHLLRSTVDRDEADAEDAKRADNAEKAGGIVSTDPTVPISSPQTPPSGITEKIDVSQQLDCEALVNLENYNEYSIHKATGSLLQETLRYHMSDDDRNRFMPGKKNDSLPIELRDKLPDKLKTWIATKYTKAYISFLIAQGEKSPFSAEQSSKLWYWWQGSGPNTLKKTSEYAQMNQIVAVYAMRQLYQTHLDPYIKAGGKYWADQLKEEYKSDKVKRGLAMSYTTMKDNGVNVVNKISNLMNALDPEGQQAKSFHGEFLDFCVKEKFLTSKYIGSTDELKTFLYDAMKELIFMVLNKDENLDAELRASILRDIDPIRQQKEASVQTQMNLLHDEMTYMTTLVVKHIHSIRNGWTFKGIETMFQQIEGTITPSVTAYPKTFKALRVCTMISLIGGAMALSLSTFINWKSLSTGQKGLAVCSILQTLGAALQSMQFFKMNPIVELVRAQPGGGNLPPGQRRPALVLELADGEALRQNIQERQLLNEGAHNSLSTAESSPRSSVSASESSNSSFGGDGPIPVAQDQRPKFNIGMGLLKAFDIFVGIGFLVFLSMEIKANFANMDIVEKWISVSQAVIQGLVVIVDITTLGVQIAASAGWIGLEAAARAMCCLSTVGAILGVVALVVMLAFIIYEATKPRPPTEAEKFAAENKALVDNLPSPPPIALDYATSSSSVPRNQAQELTITITNNKPEAVTLQSIGFLFNAGAELALFQGQEASKQEWGNTASVSSTIVGVRFQEKDPAYGNSIDVDAKPAPAATVCLAGNLRGKQTTPGQPFSNLVFKPGDWAKLLFKGMVAEKAGEAIITFLEYVYPKDSTAVDISKKEIKINKT